MKEGIITNWFMASLVDPAETVDLVWVAVGFIYNHKDFTDGERIIVDIDKIDWKAKEVYFNEHTFTLGNPDIQWRDYMKQKEISSTLKKLDFLENL